MRHWSYMRSLVLLALLLLPTLVFGQEDVAFTPLTGLPGLQGVSSAENISQFLNVLYRLCVGAAATLAVIQIIRAGFLWMKGDSVTGSKEARSLIVSSIFGLVLVLSPAIIFGLIDPRILSLSLNTNALKLEERAIQNSCTASIGEVHDGSVVQADFRHCCEASGLRAIRNGVHSSSYVCTSAPAEEEEPAPVEAEEGTYNFVLYALSSDETCIELVHGSYPDEAACSAGLSAAEAERPTYASFYRCQQPPLPTTVFNKPVCEGVVTLP